MTNPSDRAHWLTPRLEARVWHCDDEVCDCWQPVIERVTPGEAFPWIKRERLWEGSFISQPEAHESKQMIEDLRKAAADYGIELHGDPGMFPYGERDD
jgi:hypothetical protein